MPTNEERREVAEIMRDGARFSVSSCAVASRLGFECEVFETCAECESMLADRLADLIEPEERTACNERSCLKIKKKDPTCKGNWNFHCSRCNCYLRGTDSYCPNCGARVVG